MSNEASVVSWIETEVLLWWAVADIPGWLHLKSIFATRGQQRPLSVCQETGRSFQLLMVPACRALYHVITVFPQLLGWTLRILNIDINSFIFAISSHTTACRKHTQMTLDFVMDPSSGSLVFRPCLKKQTDVCHLKGRWKILQMFFFN